jgi:hypothetical protein
MVKQLYSVDRVPLRTEDNKYIKGNVSLSLLRRFGDAKVVDFLLKTDFVDPLRIQQIRDTMNQEQIQSFFKYFPGMIVLEKTVTNRMEGTERHQLAAALLREADISQMFYGLHVTRQFPYGSNPLQSSQPVLYSDRIIDTKGGSILNDYVTIKTASRMIMDFPECIHRTPGMVSGFMMQVIREDVLGMAPQQVDQPSALEYAQAA